jgi:hypothetical protein
MFLSGIFLVVGLVWINLCGQTSLDGLEQEINSLPTDLDKLDEAYDPSLLLTMYAHFSPDIHE